MKGFVSIKKTPYRLWYSAYDGLLVGEGEGYNIFKFRTYSIFLISNLDNL